MKVEEARGEEGFSGEFRSEPGSDIQDSIFGEGGAAVVSVPLELPISTTC